MRTIKQIVVLIAGLLVSCNKIETATPTFDVLSDHITVNAGDSARFDLRGDAHVITFYSGMPGSVYAYRERTQKESAGEVILSFSSQVTATYTLDPRELDVLVSTDFNGNFIYEDIIAANWHVVSSRFTFPSLTADGVLAAGEADISDMFVPGLPFYVAFRYLAVGVPPARSLGRLWRVQSFSLLNESEGRSTILADQVSAGWSIIHGGEIDPGRGGSMTSTRLTFLSNNVNRANTLDIWAITQPIDVFKTDPDKGLVIKNISQNRLESHLHVYDTPGTYTATFTASNATVYGQSTVAKEVIVTVNP